MATISLRKVIIVAGASSAIDWYDFFVYATAAALVFNSLFFPSGDPLLGTLLAFSTFAVGFLVRPIGGAIFGHIGDRMGRKPALVTSLFLMGGSTTLVGALPTYATAGVAAPIGLILLRLLQGIAVGGQWAGAALVATEGAPEGKRGFYGSLAQLGLPTGLFLSTGVFLLLSTKLSSDAFLSWGWRIPFLLSIALLMIALYAQMRLEETSSMQNVQNSGLKSRSPVIEVLRNNWRTVLLAAGSGGVMGATFYLFATYMLSYATTVLGIERRPLLNAVLIGSVISCILIPLFGALSDRIGRRKVYFAGASLLAAWIIVAYFLLQSETIAMVSLTIIVGIALVSLLYGPQAALFAELFTAHLRYSGASMGYQLGSLVGGGLTPVIATALYAEFRSFIPVVIWILILAFVSILSVRALSETAQSRLDDVAPSASTESNLTHPQRLS